MMSHDEQLGVFNNRISNLDDRLVRMEMIQERMILDFCAAYSIPLRGYHFAYHMDDTPWKD